MQVVKERSEMNKMRVLVGVMAVWVMATSESPAQMEWKTMVQELKAGIETEFHIERALKGLYPKRAK